jgi:ribosomal protein S18 acetylase RimI-like enzyme
MSIRFAGVVRDVTPADVPACAALHLATWQVAFRGIVPDDRLDALTLEDFTGRWERGIAVSERVSLLAEVEGSGPVGFVVCGPPRQPESVAPGTGEVYALYVRPESAGGGVGRALMAKAQSRLIAAGFTAVYLWTWEENAPARAFYERIGFARDGTEVVSDRFGPPLKEVRYARSLQGGDGAS